MVRHERVFYWRGDYKPGWVCPICNALYAIPGEEIEPLRALRKGEGLTLQDWLR